MRSLALAKSQFFSLFRGFIGWRLLALPFSIAVIQDCRSFPRNEGKRRMMPSQVDDTTRIWPPRSAPRDNALEFFERGKPLFDAFEGVFMHKAHTVAPREHANVVVAAAFAHSVANGIVQHQDLVNADAPFVAGHVALVASGSHTLRRGRVRGSEKQQLGKKLRSSRRGLMTRTEAADQPLRD